MLTENFYTMIAAVLHGGSDFPGDLYVAVGQGERAWDTLPPDVGRDVRGLTSELARKKVEERNITYLNEDGSTSADPTPRLRIEVAFAVNEAIGSLRECGLYGGRASETPESGTILSYYIHPLIEKTATMSLERVIRVDLSPSEVVAGSRVTRFMGNVITQEVHDLDNEQSRCQIGEIRVDRRYYFTTVEQATAAGYDRCAYCFGKELSFR